tara:strand:- start:3832 stop:4290 length:459 start_codon:yes stop_codon:yes gene_type:complete
MAYKSEVARCAAEIRKILKDKNIKASVRSQQFSMGNSVDVEIKEIVDPKVYKDLQDRLAKYEYGHFNGMYDIYEHSNLRDDIPQTKFLTIKYDWRLYDEAVEKVEKFVRGKVNLGNYHNPEYEYKRLANDLLYGRDDFIAWKEVENVIKEVA